MKVDVEQQEVVVAGHVTGRLWDAGWRQVLTGIGTGLVGAAIVLASITHGPSRPIGPQGVVLSDCDGALQSLVIHYVAEAGDVVGGTYREFLRQLPSDVVVHVVCLDHATFDDLVRRVGATDCRLEAVIVDHLITTWSRDRWLALQDAGGQQTTLLCPRSEKSQEIWPQRSGDARVGRDLAEAYRPRVAVRRSRLFFDGGDFVADDRCVFVTPDVLLRNLQQTVQHRAELLARLEYLLNRQVVLLENAPPYHAGMFMMTVGEGVVLVGDPEAAQRMLDEAEGIDASVLCSPHGADFSTETIARFNSVADQCRQAGYRVVRIPVVPGYDGRTYLTYVNVIIDQRDGKRLVYMPVYEGLERLNNAAAAVWSDLGYEVRFVDCTRCSRHFGSLRCLVNVLSRTDDGAAQVD